MPRHHHSAERWADHQRRESPRERAAFLRRWQRGEDAAVRTLRTMHAVACRVAPQKAAETSPVEDDRGNLVCLCIGLSDGQAAVWSPRTGIYVLRPPLPLRVAHAMSRLPVWEELAAITRRAFVPGILVQTYQAHPLMEALAQRAMRAAGR